MEIEKLQKKIKQDKLKSFKAKNKNKNNNKTKPDDIFSSTSEEDYGDMNTKSNKNNNNIM